MRPIRACNYISPVDGGNGRLCSVILISCIRVVLYHQCPVGAARCSDLESKAVGIDDSRRSCFLLIRGETQIIGVIRAVVRPSGRSTSWESLMQKRRAITVSVGYREVYRASRRRGVGGVLVLNGLQQRVYRSGCCVSRIKGYLQQRAAGPVKSRRIAGIYISDITSFICNYRTGYSDLATTRSYIQSCQLIFGGGTFIDKNT